MDHLQQFYKNKRVLVTGGAGFIGSHLVDALVTLGARVTVLDNFSSGTLANLKSVVGNISVIYADIRSPHSCLKATENQKIVFHLAASISVPQSIVDPITCYEINSTGTRNILESCKKNRVSNFVFSSSSAVYGNRKGLCSENDTLNPLSPYAISKVQGEEMCKQFAADGYISIGCLRYFNVYGNRQNPNGAYAAVISKFTHQLLNKLPLTIYGDGLQTRDFINISNVVEANLLIGTKELLQGDTFNIASGRSINLFQLIEKLEQELRTKHTALVFTHSRQGDILHSEANIKKYIALKEQTFQLHQVINKNIFVR